MRQAKHQLEEISGMLEQLLDDKPLQALQEDYHDSLDAKSNINWYACLRK